MANTTRTRNAERNHAAHVDRMMLVDKALEELNNAVHVNKEPYGDACPRIADKYGLGLGELAAHYDAQWD